MTGIPRKRLLFYGVLIAVALGLNALRLLQDQPQLAGAVQEGAAPVTTVPPLAAARDLAARPIAAERDLFRRPPDVAAPAPAPAPAPAAPPAPPDPMQVAREEAARVLRAMTLRGILRNGDNVLAVIEHEGRTLSLGTGQEVLPGYTVGKISNNDISIENERTGLTGILTIGGGEAVRLLGVDG